MSVSLYDLLDVPENATATEIRAAWKAAIADLDPTDRRFRAYNDAAGVLLDPEKRAAYDLELAAERDEQPSDDAPADTPVDAGAPVDAGPAPVPTVEPAKKERRASEVDPVEEPAPTSKPAAAAPTPDRQGPPTWALAAATALAVLSVALLVVVLSWPGSLGGDSPAAKEDQAAAAEEAGVSARAAADSAIPVVLGYDYRTLDQDFAEAEELLTDEFAEKRTALFDQQAESGLTLREQVVKDKVVVQAAVAATGLTRVSSDGEQATVVVYVNQDSQKGKQTPRSLKMWATLSMVADGDDWLLDDICTETDCS